MFVITDIQMRAFTDHFRSKFMDKALHQFDKVYQDNELKKEDKIGRIEAHLKFARKLNLRKEKSVLLLIKYFKETKFSIYDSFTEVEKKIISADSSDEDERLEFLAETIFDFNKNKLKCQE